MVDGAHDATGGSHRSGPPPFAPGARESSGAASEANRADALIKLESLLELGVLTQEQHDSELARLTEGDAQKSAPLQLGPVQLLVIPFVEGIFDVSILGELRHLRDHDVIGVLDLLFVAKDEMGNVAELEHSDLTAQEGATFGSLVARLFDLGADGEPCVAFAAGNPSLRDAADTWFLADTIAAGETAAIVLFEHRWAAGLRDAIHATGGRDLVDRWVHPEDLIAIGAERA